jgi:hypothetical protein
VWRCRCGQLTRRLLVPDDGIGLPTLLRLWACRVCWRVEYRSRRRQWSGRLREHLADVRREAADLKRFEEDLLSMMKQPWVP